MKSTAYLAAAVGLLIGGLSPCVLGAPSVEPTLIPQAGALNTPASATLRLKFKVGETQVYHLVMHINGTIAQNGAAAMPFDQVIDMTSTQVVQSIDPTSAAATVKSNLVMSSMTMTYNGKVIPIPTTAKSPIGDITSVIEPTGKVDSFHMDPVPGTPQALKMDTNNPMFGAIFSPDKPVSVGDTWSRSTTGGIMGMNVTTNYKLSDLSVSKGEQMATVDSTLSGNLSSTVPNHAATTMNGTFSGTQSTLFDNTAGVTDSVTSNSHVIVVTATDTSQPPPPGAAGTTPTDQKIDITQVMTMTLVSVK